jgi:subtilase family serine protease
MTAMSTTTTLIAPSKGLSLSSTVKNQGLFPAGIFTIAFHLSTDTTYGNGDDIAFTTARSLTSLAAGASSTASTTLTIPAGTPFGSYYICAMADSGDTVDEGSPADEANNTFCTVGTMQVSSSDLILTQVSPNSATAVKGGTLSVTTTVQNQGPLGAGAFRMAFRLSSNTIYGDGGDVVVTAIRSVTSLAAGASNTGTTSLTIPTSMSSGTYYVCALADSLNQVLETKESNNTLCSDGAAITQVIVP